MKKLFRKIFNIETPVNYIIAEYKPVKINSLKTEVQVTEYQANHPSNNHASNTESMTVDEGLQRD